MHQIPALCEIMKMTDSEWRKAIKVMNETIEKQKAWLDELEKIRIRWKEKYGQEKTN